MHIKIQEKFSLLVNSIRQTHKSLFKLCKGCYVQNTLGSIGSNDYICLRMGPYKHILNNEKNFTRQKRKKRTMRGRKVQSMVGKWNNRLQQIIQVPGNLNSVRRRQKQDWQKQGQRGQMEPEREYFLKLQREGGWFSWLGI